MQRYVPTGAVRVVSASTNPPPLGEPVDDDDDEYDCEDDVTEDGALDDLGLGSEAGSDVSSPLSLRVARFLDSSKQNGPKKRKRAKLNHLSGEQKVERRKILNRIAAQTARDRKKVQMDDLEKFVKELASENMRLARENADLRQKSTDLEVENVKLRTHFGRAGSAQSQQVASGSASGSQGGSVVKPTVVAVRTECVSKPVGIAARVSEPTVREVNHKVEEAAQTQSQSKVEVETQPEVKRARLNVVEGGRATPDGVCDAAQRNAAAAVFVRATRTCTIQRPLRASARQFARRTVGIVSASADSPRSATVLASRGASGAGLEAPARVDIGPGPGSGPRRPCTCGGGWRQQAGTAWCARCAPDCAQRTAARGVLEAAPQRHAHTADSRLDAPTLEHVGPSGRATQRVDGAAFAHRGRFSAFQQFTAGRGPARSISQLANPESSTLAPSSSPSVASHAHARQHDALASVDEWNDEVVIHTEPQQSDALPLLGNYVEHDLLQLFRDEQNDCSLQLGVTNECAPPNTRNQRMNELFERLVANLEVN